MLPCRGEQFSFYRMPVIRIEIPQELLLNSQKEVVIRLNPAQLALEEEVQASTEPAFLCFMDKVIDSLRAKGQLRTTETYLSARSSFAHFRKGKDCRLGEIDHHLINAYETWLKQRGVKKNTISFYMRILRAVYNRAIDQHELPDTKPFRHVYTGVERTRKRAISAELLQEIQRLYPKVSKEKQFAIDMFFFSFYARGMSFVDMAYLMKTDIVANVIVYQRRKTGQRLQVKCEKELIEITSKYANDSPFLLPIITDQTEPSYQQYRRCQRRVNRHLKDIGIALGLQHPLTTYVARHSWATIARNLDIPISVISESMGHTSEKTTRIYLDSISSNVIDRANQSIIEAVSLPPQS